MAADTQTTKQSSDTVSLGRSAALISVLIVVSRLSGFLRTWTEARTLGATVLTSCYEVASYMPTQIFELVTAGMLTGAFLPVYLAVKKRLGKDGSDAYASNVASITILFTSIISIISFIFAAQIIWTQSFSAVDDFDSARATWFFRFFVIEIVLYGCSAILSSVLNAERDYLWSNLAPIFNNLVVTASFVLYSVFATTNPELALLVLALGNPLGVAIQVVMQLPSLISHGVKLTWRIDFSDPALKDTLQIGVPSIVVMLLFFVISSMQVNAMLSVTALGASVNSYSILWYNLPYAVLAVPIMTVLFTELSDFIAKDDMDSFRTSFTSGITQILFMLVPFACYLALFSPELITLISSGRFEPDTAQLVVQFLAFKAPSLPLMGIANYLQKASSPIHKMGLYAGVYTFTTIFEVILLQLFTPLFGLNFVAFSTFIYRGVFALVLLLLLQRDLGNLNLGSMLISALRSLVLGLIGSAVAMLILFVMSRLGVGANSMFGAFARCVCAGIPAVVVSYGLALALKLPESAIVNSLLKRVLHRA